MNQPGIAETKSSHTQNLRYAVLRHEGVAEPHWDLVLEVAGEERLATWQIRISPESWGGPDVVLSAVRIADHRRVYLDYEGPLSENRGFVVRVAEGTYSLLVQTPEQWRIRLSGTVSAEILLPALMVS